MRKSPSELTQKQVLKCISGLLLCFLVAKSCLTLSATPPTVAHQAPLSMRFSRQEYRSGLPFPSPGDLADPGIQPNSSALAGGVFCFVFLLLLRHQGSP